MIFDYWKDYEFPIRDFFSLFELITENIGKKGVHADAIRRIVHAIGGKKKKRYILEIVEERAE